MVNKVRTVFCIFAALWVFCVVPEGVPVYAQRGDRMLVEVNSEVITQREFNRTFEPIKERIEATFSGEEREQRLEEARKGILEQMIDAKIAVSIARKEKVEIDQKELENRINQIQSYYGNREEFLKALKDKGTNLTEFTKEMEDQMLAQELVQKKIAGKITITPGEVMDVYEDNKERLVSPESYKVRTLMVQKTGEANKEKDISRLEGIKAEILGGKDFSVAVSEKSEGPFAEREGDMGYVIRGQLAPQLEEPIFDLEQGEISEVVETPIGFHIFKVEDIQAARQLSFEETNDFLRDQIYQRKFEEELVNWLQEVRKEAHVSYK